MSAADHPGAPAVLAVWRHPVKSLQGESLGAAVVEADGLHGDRSWAIRDEATGKILTGRREPRLLAAASAVGDDGVPTITLPDGTAVRGATTRTHAALSDWLGRPVTLVAAVGATAGRAEYFADATDDTSDAIEWTMPAGRFVDAMPLLLLTTASLRAASTLYPEGDWAVRRFRPNVVIDVASESWVEDQWCGRTVRVGSVEVVPRQPCVRCTMVSRPQPELERDLGIYKTVARHHAGTLGVWTTVQVPGTIRTGDPVELI